MNIKFTKVLIVDDHPMFGDSIAYLLKDVNFIKIVGVENNGKDAIGWLSTNQVDIILMDISMPIMDGIETTSFISKKYPNIKVIALTALEEQHIVKEMLRVGAKGYISKGEQVENIINAIIAVEKGNIFYFGKTYSSTDNISFVSTPEDALSDRERDIMRCIALGLSTKDIAENLFISPNTVKTHRSNIMSKLNIKTTVELVRYAVEKNAK